jgi:NADPH:quinone reductase-like Zn-dependent oxidoreductase
MIEAGEPRPLTRDEVLLEVRAAGVGNWDEFVRTGGWDVGAKPPMALGVEAPARILSASPRTCSAVSAGTGKVAATSQLAPGGLRASSPAGAVMPRCWLGGCEVMVASRPPSATARIALAAPLRAAFTAAATP